MNRRYFLASAALGALATTLGPVAFAATRERLRVGIIGTGLRGQVHLDELLKRGDVDVTAICDIEAAMLDAALKLCDKAGRYVMACVPGNARVDPRAVRANLPGEWGRLHFANAQEILAVTGCVQGAVSPLGLPEDVPVLFDEALASSGRVNISSGDPMAGLELDPKELIRVARARIAQISERD